MANSIAYIKNYTTILDEVYKRAATSGCLNSPRRMAKEGRNAKEIMIPKISVTGLGNYTRNVGYRDGAITYEYETKTFNYYELAGAGAPINFMVVEKSAVIKFDKHIASRVFRPDELETLDSYMMKYRKYGIMELFDNKLDGVYVNAGMAV